MAEKFINVDSQTLDIEIADRPRKAMSILVKPTSLTDLPPLWHSVYYDFMYATVHKEDRKRYAAERERGIVRRYSLTPPPLWLVTIAGLMWEGIIQGASWDLVKAAIKAALDKLINSGLAPESIRTTSEKETSLNIGWTKYAKSGRKQYEMYLHFRKTISHLPDEHAMATARAKDQNEFARIVRGELGKNRSGKESPTRKKRSRS